MSAPLMVTFSGIRGIAGKSLTTPVVRKYVNSFAVLQSKKKDSSKVPLMIVGRDSRVSGPSIRDEVVDVLLKSGYKVIDCGIVPTPTVQFHVLREHAIGGVIITSSHNPGPWNGLKFVDDDSLFLSPELCQEMFSYADSHPNPSFDDAATITEGNLQVLPENDAAFRHVDFILDLPYIKPDAIKAQHFKVCLDTVCGAGGPAMTYLLKKLGVDVVELNTETSGVFPHTPEPVPENLGDLCRAVVENSADCGIAVDPDVDRCVFIGEDGKPLVEEYTLAIAVKFILGDIGRRGAVCKNLSSSRVLDDIAAQYGCTLIPAAVGEINVAKAMVKHNAVIGGEGNGGVMLPDVHIGRDSPVATALVLQCLTNARENKESGIKTISELKKSLPQYEIVKLKADIEGIKVGVALETFKKEAEEAGLKIITIDGLHISGDDWWVHLRQSNTEPIVRVIGEAPTAEAAEAHCKEYMKRFTAFR